MLTFTVRMRFDEPDLPAMREALIALTQGSRAEPGCVSYICHTLADDPCTVMIYEQYRDEAALEAHRATPHFKQHAIGGLYQHMRDRQIENMTAIA